MGARRKVCFTGPMRVKIAEDILRTRVVSWYWENLRMIFLIFATSAGELIQLIGDCRHIVYPSGRDVIGGEILDSCPDLQAVVKSSIGIETVDVEAATDLGILCCNSPTPENYLGVAEATMGLMVALFKRLKFNEAVFRNGGWKELAKPWHLDDWPNSRNYRRRPHRPERRQTAGRLGHEDSRLRSLREARGR